MKISDDGIKAIKSHEGCELVAYPDPATGGAPWTIGYGHTAGVRNGDRITEAEAEAFLRQDLQWVERAIDELVRRPLSQQQHDALASLIFNIGAGAFAGSTMLRKINAGDMTGAAAEFDRWNKAAGRVMAGLTSRRATERAMFEAGTYAPAAPPIAATAPPAATPRPISLEESTVPLPAFVAAALPAIISSIPNLAKIFGSGSEVSERNVKAAELAVGIVQEAVGARNAQETAEILAADPAAVQAAGAAVAARWLELTETGGGGIEGAGKRDAATMQSGGMLQSPSLWIAVPLLGLVYLLVLSLIGLIGTASWSDDVRAGLAGSLISAVVGGLVGYYYGQTTSRNRTPAP